MNKEIPVKKALHILITASFIIYLFALFYLTIGKSGAVMINGMEQRANLIPFHTIKNYLKQITRLHAMVNLVGNLLLLLPMAIYLPYFIKALRKLWKDTLAILAIILIIEITEYISKRGSFDVDDIILNLLGAMIGYGIWKLKPLQKLVGFIQNKDDEKKD